MRPCIGCGQCCGHYLPLSEEDITRASEYAKDHGIEPNRTGVDCPWLAKNRTCSIYEARPAICRAFHCDRSKAKTMPGALEDYHVYNAERLFIDGDRTTYDALARFVEQMGRSSYVSLFRW